MDSDKLKAGRQMNTTSNMRTQCFFVIPLSQVIESDDDNGDWASDGVSCMEERRVTCNKALPE